MKNHTQISFTQQLRNFKKIILPILLIMSLPALGQKPKLSFFTELPSVELEALFADSTVISDLHAMEAEIRMGILDFSPERVRVVQQLNREGIPVVGWLLLPKEEGYWFNMENGADALQRYEDFQEWTLANNLQWAGVGIDLEPSMEDIVLMTNNPRAALKKAFGRLFDSSRIEKGTADYQKVISRIKSDGYALESYILPFLFDEREANSRVFQRVTGILDIPSDLEIPMLYSSFYGPNGAAFIPLYGKGLKAVAIGSTGGGVEIEGMTQIPPTLSWEDLERDIILAGNVVEQVHIFCLESSVERGYLPKIKDIDYSQPTPDLSANITQLDQTRSKIQWVLTLLDYPILLSIIALLILALILGFLVWLTKKAIQLFKTNQHLDDSVN